MAFTSIPNSDIDADSPLTTTLVTALRDNDNYLNDQFNTSTGHDHDGTDSKMIPNIFGTWTTTKALTTVYQAAKDLIVMVTGTTTAATGYLTAYSDSSATPTTIRGNVADAYGGGVICITFPVKKDDYFKVLGANVTLNYYMDLSIG